MQQLAPIPPHVARFVERFDVPDQDLIEQAARAAASVQRLNDIWTRNGTEPEQVLRVLRRIAKRHAIRMPEKAGLEAALNRMADPAYWRRALRRRLKWVELAQIERGAVHAHASPYVSAKTLRRHQRQARRIAEQMEALEAVNQTTGEARPMSELLKGSLANPANRRAAMMVRIKGIEASATERGHVGLLLTITCPSRMHPRHSKTGAANLAYDGTWPTRAQKYLRTVWSQAMRAADHQGLKAYGLRAVEPHHDACPHWHVLAFIDPAQADAFIALMRSYALRDTPEEPGAQERRFTVIRIDPSKGSALGYVAKYVAKSIDGEGVDTDHETGRNGRESAQRQVAWARTWSIRQFQFFGVPPITPTREFFRVEADSLKSPALQELHAACKANDYGAWLAQTEAHALRFAVAYAVRPSGRYRDEQAKAIEGLRIKGGDLARELHITTRCDTWRIQRRVGTAGDGREGEQAGAQLASPWTRINNSAPLDLKGLFPGALPEEARLWDGEEGGVSRTGHRYPVRDEAIGEKPARSLAAEPTTTNRQEPPC